MNIFEKKKMFFSKFESPNVIIKAHDREISKISINQSKKIFISASFDSILKIWNLNNCSYVSNLSGHIGSINTVLLDEKYNIALSGGDDMGIKCWDIEYNKIISTYNGHFSSVTCLAMHPILNIVISSSNDCTVRLWDLRARKEVKTLLCHKNTVTSVITNPETPHIITSSMDRTVCMWDVVMNKPVNQITGNKEGIIHLKKCKNHDFFFGLSKGFITVFRKNGSVIKKIINCKHTNIDFCTINNYRIISSEKGGILKIQRFPLEKIKVFDITTQKIFGPTKNDCEISTIEFDNLSKKIICGTENGRICILSRNWKSV